MFSHRLHICTDGWGSARVARHERVCSCCAGDRDDEKHVLFCPDPANVRLRRDFQDVMAPSRRGYGDDWMRGVMNPRSADGWQRLAQFLLTFMFHRERAARGPQQQAQRPVVNLPDEL